MNGPSSAAAFPNQLKLFEWETCCVTSGFRVGVLETQKKRGIRASIAPDFVSLNVKHVTPDDGLWR
jgi:hypothetical protein